MAGTRAANVSTNSVSARGGFEWWSSMVAEAVIPVSIACERVDSFVGEAASLQLPRTQVSAFRFSPMSACRTPIHIRRADPESYFLFLVHGGPVGLEQRRNNILLRAGDMALFDTSVPLACEFRGGTEPPRLTMIRLPRTAIPLPLGRTDELVATLLPTRTGSGALLTSYLTGLRDQATHCDEAELLRLGSVGFDLATAFLATRLDAASGLPADTRRQVLLARIHTFIDHNLGNPQLTPTYIAENHHISVRTLHQLFRTEASTVAATIRRRRLERCQADLADPRQRSQSISALAARWGFLMPAEFSRAFRAAHGMTPTEFRHEAIRQARTAPGHK
ncbi:MULTISPECIES: helix-turn-helix domain-containing protein [unclassified Streptomyces]|uniref:AraC-like ligand-binding domain-containing protein n=1 Tax=unclassified Streptomyces TaxID=2593676 RepID=UPI00382D414A